VESSPSASVAAVVVHYRTQARLRECLAALESQGAAPAEIVVIDNSCGSDAATPPGPHELWRLHQAAANLGFGAACNLGASLTHSDHLLFLNADLVLHEGALESLREVAQVNPRTAVIGPRIYAADGEIELSARSFPSMSTGVLGRSSLATRLSRRLMGPPRQVSSALGDQTTVVDWVSGACMLVRRPAFEEVGGFDEGYWMYWEDADLCRRLSDRGWTTMLCVEATARHSTGSSGTSARTIEAFHDSAARYYGRHVARSGATAAIARGLLKARMRVMLHRHGERTADRTAP
jgi:GT2 family glycosyltransferase